MAIDTPPGIVLEIARDDLPEDLFPDERAYVMRCVPRRVNEFVTVRACARAALAQLGYHRPPLLSLDGHGPVWPRGTVGSMTHCEGFRAAAVGLSEQWLTLGIDAEPNEPLPPGCWARWQMPKSAGTSPSFCPHFRPSLGIGCCSAGRRPSTRRGLPSCIRGLTSTRHRFDSMLEGVHFWRAYPRIEAQIARA